MNDINQNVELRGHFPDVGEHGQVSIQVLPICYNSSSSWSVVPKALSPFYRWGNCSRQEWVTWLIVTSKPPNCRWTIHLGICSMNSHLTSLVCNQLAAPSACFPRPTASKCLLWKSRHSINWQQGRPARPEGSQWTTSSGPGWKIWVSEYHWEPSDLVHYSLTDKGDLRLITEGIALDQKQETDLKDFPEEYVMF